MLLALDLSENHAAGIGIGLGVVVVAFIFKAVMNRLDTEGIDMPFPTRTLEAALSLREALRGAGDDRGDASAPSDGSTRDTFERTSR